MIPLLTDAPTHAVPDQKVEEKHGIMFIQLSNIKLIYQPTSRALCSPLTRPSLPCLRPTTGARSWILEETSKPGNQSSSLEEDLRTNFHQRMR
jgi:hypothetical protein